MKKTGRDQFKRYKKLINFLVFFFSFFSAVGNKFLLNFFRNTNGKVGILLRYVFVKNLSKSVGDNVSIHPGVFLFNVDKLSLGNNISIHPMCYIDAAGEIVIGDNVSIAHCSTIISTNHTWKDTSIPIKYNSESFGKVILEDDIWIGCGVRVLANVTIRNRSIVAAGAVVNKSTESNSLIGGTPAKLIKKINL